MNPPPKFTNLPQIIPHPHDSMTPAIANSQSLKGATEALTAEPPLSVLSPREIEVLDLLKSLLDTLPSTSQSSTSIAASPYHNSIVNHTLSSVHKLSLIQSIMHCINEYGEYFSTEVENQLIHGFRSVLLSIDKDLASQGFRGLRYLLLAETRRFELFRSSAEFLGRNADNSVWNRMMTANIDVILVKHLAHIRPEYDREQPFMLIREALESPLGNSKLMPKAVIRTLAATAEIPEDPFSKLCVQTLCELMIRDPEKCCTCGALRQLLICMTEQQSELVESVIFAVAYVLDSPETRKYVKPFIEIECVISKFTDAYVKRDESKQSLGACAKALGYLMSTWPGLIYLNLNRGQAIRSLIEMTSLPYPHLVDVILDVFISLLKIPLAVAKSSDAKIGGSTMPNVLDAYACLLVSVLIDAGILVHLTQVFKSCIAHQISKANILIEGLIFFANRLLPPSHQIAVNALANVFGLATDVVRKNANVRSSAQKAISDIEQVNQLHQFQLIRQAQTEMLGQTPLFHSVRDAPSSTSMPPPSTLKDAEAHIRSLIIESGVLATKDYTLWNWNIIQSILHGPMQHANKLDDMLKNTKFVKGVIGFYKPSRAQFSEIRKSAGSAKYVRIGCELLETLICHPEGVIFLADSKLLYELVDILNELGPNSVVAKNRRFLSRDRIARSLTSEYVSLLGILTRNTEGLKLLERFKAFDIMYQLLENEELDEISKSLLLRFDFSHESHCRVLLSKALISGSNALRYFCTSLCFNIFQKSKDETDKLWIVDLLARQLYDESQDVQRRASYILQAVCQSERALEAFVKNSPYIYHLGTNGDLLAMRLMSYPCGFKYLHSIGYIAREHAYWSEKGSKSFVAELELTIDNLFSLGFTSTSSLPDAATSLPIHFYGEVAKTANGVQFLQTTGFICQLNDFLSSCLPYLLQSASSGSSAAPVMNEETSLPARQSKSDIKACIWTIVYIGSSTHGLRAIQEFKLASRITHLANSCTVFSIKGTCLQALGVIAQTYEGSEFLSDQGFQTIRINGTGPDVLVLPRQLTSFFSLPSWKSANQATVQSVKKSGVPLGQSRYSGDPIEDELVKCLGNLSNNILANAASKTLSRIRYENPEYFSSLDIYMKAFELLGNYQYRLSARRFIQELFEEVDLSLESFKSYQLELEEMAETLAAQMNAPVDDRQAESQLSEDLTMPSRTLIFVSHYNGKRNNNEEEAQDESSLVGGRIRLPLDISARKIVSLVESVPARVIRGGFD